MLLAVDVGNSHIVLGLYEGEKIKEYWRISSDNTKTSHEWAVVIGGLFDRKGIDWNEVSGVILSSVVPGLTVEIKRMCQDYLEIEPLIVHGSIDVGIKVKVDNPLEVGADRLVNAIAAFEKYGGPAIVVDFGTATTFDAISSEGDYLGGAIAPGAGISIEALFANTAQLPRIDLVKPSRVIGKNTITSMQSGILYSIISQVDGVVSKMKDELPGEVKVIATGGLAGLIAPECAAVDEVDDYLTLDGLRLIANNMAGEEG